MPFVVAFELQLKAKWQNVPMSEKVAQPRQFWRRCSPQPLELTERSGENDLLHGVADRLPDPRVNGEVRVLVDELFDTFRKRPDRSGGTLIRLDLIGSPYCLD